MTYVHPLPCTNTLDQQYHVGEKLTVIILHTYINLLEYSMYADYTKSGENHSS